MDINTENVLLQFRSMRAKLADLEQLILSKKLNPDQLESSERSGWIRRSVMKALFLGFLVGAGLALGIKLIVRDTIRAELDARRVVVTVDSPLTCICPECQAARDGNQRESLFH